MLTLHSTLRNWMFFSCSFCKILFCCLHEPIFLIIFFKQRHMYRSMSMSMCGYVHLKKWMPKLRGLTCSPMGKWMFKNKGDLLSINTFRGEMPTVRVHFSHKTIFSQASTMYRYILCDVIFGSNSATSLGDFILFFSEYDMYKQWTNCYTS